MKSCATKAAITRLQINAQNCVHCKTCDIKDPDPEYQLGRAARWRRADLSEHVMLYNPPG
jgi:hypothetical protein